jgi:mannose/fructose-specific phosphotransferase system component IIA
MGVSPHALDLDEAALAAPSLQSELAVELVLSDRLGGSPLPPAKKVGNVARSSCTESSRGVRGRAAVLLVEVCLLRETEGVRDLSHEVSCPAALSATGVVDCSEQSEDAETVAGQ